MAAEGRARGAAERGVALALLGVLLFNRPFLDLFDRGVDAAGSAPLYLYLFAVWGLVVLLLFLVTRRRT
ncbi:MAG: hypothetical protein ACOC3D_05835 [Pseudomonadota bacterium]